MPVSERKLAANRANARKSTGPRSAEGKRASSGNATSHGIFCKHLVLEGESHKLFIVLRQQFLLRLAPQDIVELMLVDRIVSSTWKLRRLQEAQSHLHQTKVDEIRGVEDLELILEDNYQKDPHPDRPRKPRDVRLPASMVLATQLYADEDGLTERLGRYEQRLEYSIHRCMRELRQIRKDQQNEDLLTPSPYLEDLADDEQGEVQGDESSSKMKNEPTAKREIASGGRGATADADENNISRAPAVCEREPSHLCTDKVLIQRGAADPRESNEGVLRFKL